VGFGRSKNWWAKVIFLTLFAPLLVYAFSSSPPLAVTGGFGERNCTECHVGTLNSGPGSVTITAPGTYSSGQTYQITVRVEDSNRIRWGFELAARDQQGQQAGSLESTDSSTRVRTFSNGVQYVSHQDAPIAAQGSDFGFNWTAPNTSAGPVMMHVAGNAANGNTTTSGDRIYTSSITIQPQAVGPPPSIFTGGVVNNASYAKSPAPMAPGSIAAIFGTNLNDGSQIPSSNFGEDGKLITELGGASVTINGIAVPIFYSFPSQLGVQIPFQLSSESSALVEVSVGGKTSEPRTILLDSTAPGCFTLNQAGTGQGAVLIANSDILVAPADSILGRTSRPAQRGEIITIFCTGLGMVEPTVATGAPAGASQTPTPATVTIDGLSADVLYSGTAPGFVGLYQINATVPHGARIADDVPLLVTMQSEAFGFTTSNIATIAVASGGLPDLEVSSLTAPTQGYIGSNIFVDAGARNSGNVPSSAFDIGLYLSLQSNPAIFLTSCPIDGGLEVGAEDGCSGEVPLPASLLQGSYLMFAKVDDLNQIVESSEGNNTRTADTGLILLQ
jgi:uncharacterized protein (TIGR03437 family)